MTDCLLPAEPIRPCEICNREVYPFQAAHWSCKCGAAACRCNVCDYQGYATVDAFRRNHRCEP